MTTNPISSIMDSRPDHIDEDTFLQLIEEYADMLSSAQDMRKQPPEWWHDDQDGRKAQAWADLMEVIYLTVDECPEIGLRVPSNTFDQRGT